LPILRQNNQRGDNPMIDQIDDILETLQAGNIKVLHIALRIEDYCKLDSDWINLALVDAKLNTLKFIKRIERIHGLIDEFYFNDIPVYQSIELQESTIVALKDGFYVIIPIKPKGVGLIVDSVPVQDECIRCGKPVDPESAMNQRKFGFAGTYCSEHNLIGKIQPPMHYGKLKHDLETYMMCPRKLWYEKQAHRVAPTLPQDPKDAAATAGASE
jgi:hypothetical protein